MTCNMASRRLSDFGALGYCVKCKNVRVVAESTAMFLESVIKQHLALWDGLRNSYSKKIENEYELMRNGHSNALSIVDDALNLVNLAVGRLPANIQARI